MNDSLTTIHQIRQHSRELVRELDFIKGVFQNTGYTYSQCHILFELDQHKVLNLMELSDLLVLDKSNTSRTVKKLVEEGLIKIEKMDGDNRQKLFSLTIKGKKVLHTNNCLADDQVEQALNILDPSQREEVIRGLGLYAKALNKSRRQAAFTIRPMQKKDNPKIARIIREVMTEFQAVGEGYSINDPEVDKMYETYKNKQSCFYVIEHNGTVVGGGGIAPLEGGDGQTCELRKMYFLPVTRGVGLGKKMLLLLLDEARKIGFQTCYLETLDRMWSANKLYLNNGFELLKAPMGSTGHCSCDRWYKLDLSK